MKSHCFFQVRKIKQKNIFKLLFIIFFFIIQQGINWDDLATKKVPAPFKPNIVNELDTSNFADEFTKQVAADSPAIVPTGENLFRGYSYIAPSIIFSNSFLFDTTTQQQQQQQQIMQII